MSDDTGCQIKVRRFGRSQVDDKFERGWLLDRYFGKRRRANLDHLPVNLRPIKADSSRTICC
jgi:hypothetical protein